MAMQDHEGDAGDDDADADDDVYDGSSIRQRALLGGRRFPAARLFSTGSRQPHMRTQGSATLMIA
eukprot:4389793-Amphidinium_carterae.1